MRAVLTSVVAFVALMLIRPALGGWIGRYELGVILVLSIASGLLATRYRMTVVLLALPALGFAIPVGLMNRAATP